MSREELLALAGLSDESRTLWIKTVLAITGTDPQRRAFIDGFNGYGPPRHPSRKMLEQHALGGQVHSVLHPASLRARAADKGEGQNGLR